MRDSRRKRFPGWRDGDSPRPEDSSPRGSGGFGEGRSGFDRGGGSSPRGTDPCPQGRERCPRGGESSPRGRLDPPRGKLRQTGEERSVPGEAADVPREDRIFPGEKWAKTGKEITSRGKKTSSPGTWAASPVIFHFSQGRIRSSPGGNVVRTGEFTHGPKDIGSLWSAGQSAASTPLPFFRGSRMRIALPNHSFKMVWRCAYHRSPWGLSVVGAASAINAG